MGRTGTHTLKIYRPGFLYVRLTAVYDHIICTKYLVALKDEESGRTVGVLLVRTADDVG